MAFPQDISLDPFKDTAVEKIVLFYGVLGDNWILSVLFISTSPNCLVTDLLHTLPGATALPYRHDCLFFEPLSFVSCGFCFSDRAQKGNLFSLYLHKCVWESLLLSQVLLRAGSDWLRGKATANVMYCGLWIPPKRWDQEEVQVNPSNWQDWLWDRFLLPCCCKTQRLRADYSLSATSTKKVSFNFIKRPGDVFVLHLVQTVALWLCVVLTCVVVNSGNNQ